MQSKIAIVGPGASGKDYLRKKMQDRGLVFGVSCTTRPAREGEIHGKDYYYLTEEGIQAQRIKSKKNFDIIKKHT